MALWPVELHPQCAPTPLACAREAGRLFVSFVYECTRGALFSSTPRRCNIGHMLMWVALGVGGSHASSLVSLLAGRTVRVKPVPYAPGPSSPCAVRRGSWVSFPSIMTKIVYFSQRIKQGCVTYFCRLRFLV